MLCFKCTSASLKPNAGGHLPYSNLKIGKLNTPTISKIMFECLSLYKILVCMCAFVCSLIFLHWESRVKNFIIEIYFWLKILEIYTICSGAATSKIYFTKIIIQTWIFTFSSMESFSYWTKNEKKVCHFDSVFNPLFLQIS